MYIHYNYNCMYTILRKLPVHIQIEVQLPQKCATSAPAEGPAYGHDFVRRCGFSLRTLQAQFTYAQSTY